MGIFRRICTPYFYLLIFLSSYEGRGDTYPSGSYFGTTDYLTESTSYWIDTTLTEAYGSRNEVLQSFAPTAMVDNSGDLYMAYLVGCHEANGAKFKIQKVSHTNNASISYTIYPWTKLGMSIDCRSNPRYIWGDDYESYIFKQFAYNSFTPIIAQEVGEASTDKVYIFWDIPACRNFYGSNDSEGIFYCTLKKDLTILNSYYWRHLDYSDSKRYFLTYNRKHPHMNTDPNKTCKLQPDFGSHCAVIDTDTSKVSMLNLGLSCAAEPGIDLYGKCRYNFIRTSNTPSGDFEYYSVENGHSSPKDAQIFQRVYKFNNYLYFFNTTAYYYKTFTFSATSETIARKAQAWASIYLESTMKGTEDYTYYPSDCLIINGNILCVLEFRARTAYHGITNSYYTDTYLNFPCTNLALVLDSYPMSASPTQLDLFDPGEYTDVLPNDILYTTDFRRSGSQCVSCENTSKGDFYRLYLNTCKLVEYKGFIIFAYCYPGKTKQLFLGYAPYTINPNNTIRLGTKVVFEDESGNSFEGFTSCSRIISMEIKNNQLWITWCTANDDGYRYFHIDVRDLLGFR